MTATDCYQLLPTATDCYRLLLTATDYYRLLPIATDCYRLLPIATECYRLLPIATDCYQLLPTATDCYQLLPTANDCYRLLPTATDCYRLLPASPNYVRYKANFFYVSDLSITLDNDQLDAQIFNTFITILYMYTCRAICCSSSEGQIVLIQYLVSSLSVSDRPVHRLRNNCFADGHLLRLTIPDAVLIQFNLLRMSNILLDTCTCRGL
jgi:hypothetical protein